MASFCRSCPKVTTIKFAILHSLGTEGAWTIKLPQCQPFSCSHCEPKMLILNPLLQPKGCWIHSFVRPHRSRFAVSLHGCEPCSTQVAEGLVLLTFKGANRDANLYPAVMIQTSIQPSRTHDPAPLPDCLPRITAGHVLFGRDVHLTNPRKGLAIQSGALSKKIETCRQDATNSPLGQ